MTAENALRSSCIPKPANMIRNSHVFYLSNETYLTYEHVTGNMSTKHESLNITGFTFQYVCYFHLFSLGTLFFGLCSLNNWKQLFIEPFSKLNRCIFR